MNLQAKEQIKSLIAQKGVTLKKLAELLTTKTNKAYSASGLSHKLGRGTITYNEVVMIANVLEFEIFFRDVELSRVWGENN